MNLPNQLKLAWFGFSLIERQATPSYSSHSRPLDHVGPLSHTDLVSESCRTWPKSDLVYLNRGIQPMSNLVQANLELALDPTDWFGSKTNLEPNPTIILNIFFLSKNLIYYRKIWISVNMVWRQKSLNMIFTNFCVIIQNFKNLSLRLTM